MDLPRETKGNLHHVALNSVGQLNPRSPYRGLQGEETAAGSEWPALLRLSTLTALTPTWVCEHKSWNLFFFFKVSRDMEHLHKFKFMSHLEICFYMYSLSEKKH